MSHDLEDFESELKKQFSSEMEFLPAKELQKIISYLGLSLIEFCKIVKDITISAGPKAGCLKSSSVFASNAYTIGYGPSVSGDRKLCYIYCSDTRSNPHVQYVVSFSKNHEPRLLRYLIKMDKLKAFL